MKHSKLLLAGVLAAAAWCGASQAQSVLYGVEHFGSSSGTTPSESNWSAYPKHPANIGYAVSGYWDNGVWWERTDPVVVDSRGGVSYVYPETARLVPPPSAIVYTPPRPAIGPYGDLTYDPRTKSIRGSD